MVAFAHLMDYNAVASMLNHIIFAKSSELTLDGTLTRAAILRATAPFTTESASQPASDSRLDGSMNNDEQQLTSCSEALRRADVSGFLRAIGEQGMSPQLLQATYAATDIQPGVLSQVAESVCAPLADCVIRVQPENVSYWCYPTKQIRRMLHFIDTTCTPGSPIHSWLVSNPSMLMQLHVENAISSSRLDGEIEIDPESARELLFFGREPRGRPESVVANSFALFKVLDQHRDAEWSLEFIVDIYSRLCDGLDLPPDWLDRPLKRRLPSTIYPYDSARNVLEDLCTMANRERSAPRFQIDPDVHPVLAAIMVERVSSVWKPFPMLNDLMSRLLWHSYAERIGYPVLSVIPYSSAVIAAPAVPGISAIVTSAGRGSGVWTPRSDLTDDYTRELKIIENALLDLKSRIAARNARDESLRALLAVDPELNPRQRTLIGRALRHPSAIFRIPYHQTWHAVSYATARLDFIELENKGWLVHERRGRGHIFKPAADLASRIGNDLAASLSNA